MNEKSNKYSLRNEFGSDILCESNVDPDPFLQFSSWFDDALRFGVVEPNAMVLSTTNGTDRVSGRVVLLKNVTDGGFVFFTNYESKKAMQISNFPFGSLTFLWLEMERQVRIEGRIEKASERDSDDYFSQRPRSARISAYISPQSRVIPDRAYLDKKQEEAEMMFENKEIPRPKNWGGYILKPTLIEFWQGRSGRLHDRIQYTADKIGENWTIERLAP